MINPSARDYYAYDARARLTNQTEYITGVKYQTLFVHDSVGNVAQVTYPDGYVLSMTFDALNRMKTAGTFATVTYTLDSQVSKIVYGDGEVATYTYDNRDRPTQILDKYGATKEMSLNYTYDATGNVLSLNTESYGYDWLNRLTSTTGPWGSITYTYDQVGNRLKMVQGLTKIYSYGSFNRLSGAGGTSYTYDPNGNMVNRNGSAWVYSYDYENRLTKVVHSGTTVQLNFYDGDGNRIKKTETDTTVYSYQGLNILYEKDTTTGTVTKHFYANGMQVAKMVGVSTYYLHQDGLGSTRLTMTSTVTVSFSTNYIPYGPNYGTTGSEVFQYTGKPFDSPTGFYYEGARYYDSSVGRFVTQDSVTGRGEDPQSLNRYIYARDNPMRLIDVGGHEFWNPFAAVSSAVSAVAGAATNVVSAVSNAWNSLPPPVQDAIIVAAAVTVTVATAGAAAPAILAAATIVGASSAAITAGYQYATTGTISPDAVINSFTYGFAATAAVGVAATLIGGVVAGGAVEDAATTAEQALAKVPDLEASQGITGEASLGAKIVTKAYVTYDADTAEAYASATKSIPGVTSSLDDVPLNIQGKTLDTWLEPIYQADSSPTTFQWGDIHPFGGFYDSEIGSLSEVTNPALWAYYG